MSNPGYNVNISFKYDENGIRTQKTVGDVQTDFITSGIKVLAQKTGENTIIWQTDANGNTVGFTYNGTQYFYLKNAQNDIVGITDTSGEIVANYTYDSWGKLISITDSNGADRTTDTSFIGYINPIRYRGYYYDSETGLYYLNARYYDPEVGRFINADETLEGGLNLFEYCLNNPINFADYKGKLPICIGEPMQNIDGVKTSYNCYGWAINKVTGIWRAMNPPGFVRDFKISRTVKELAKATVQGLSDAGAKGAHILGSLTNLELQQEIDSLADNQYLIAMRMNLNPGGDYHYMRLEDDRTWTHKQGSGGMLFMLNGITPNDDDAWVSYDGDPFDGRAWLPRDFNNKPVRYSQYNSEVWYIRVTI